MFFSLQELVHDRGVVCHSGVICIHCCHLDDRGPCGEENPGLLLCDGQPLTPFPDEGRWGSGCSLNPPPPGLEGEKAALFSEEPAWGQSAGSGGGPAPSNMKGKENRWFSFMGEMREEVSG